MSEEDNLADNTNTIRNQNKEKGLGLPKDEEKNPQIVLQEKKREKLWIFLQSDLRSTFTGIGFFFRHPKDAIKWVFKQKVFIIYLVAILSGLMGAGAAWVFSNFLSLSRILFYGLIFDLTPDKARFLLIILLPTIAAAISAPMLLKWAPEAKGHGIPEVMESIVYKDGYIKTATPYLKMLLSGICIGGGLSLGSEGPIAQIGGGFSSFLGRKFKLSGRRIKTVVVCGLVAGISAIFNAPIGAALFGLEILIISLSADQLIPIIVSSLIANTVGRLILENGPEAIFQIPEELSLIKFQDYTPYLHWFVLLGIVTGFASVFYVKSVGIIEKLAHKIKTHPIVWPISGAAITGLIGLISPRATSQDLEFRPSPYSDPLIIRENVEGIPRIFGVGYDTITALFENKPIEDGWTLIGGGVIFVVLLLLVLKILATACSVGTGNSGGVFAPALFIGATTGYGFAVIINRIFPSLAFELQDYALFTLVGLASVFSGSARAVLTMIFMSSEMTHSYYTFIPLMISCTISFFISKVTMRESIYTQKLAIRGVNINLAGPTELLELYKVKDIMTKDIICVPEDMRMAEFHSFSDTMDHVGYPIINMQGEFLGMITNIHLKKATALNEMDKTVLDFAEREPYVLYPEETVDQAMRLLYRSDLGRLVVLDSIGSKNIIGIVSNTDVLKCLEMQRLKDLEERKSADQKLIKTELQMVEKAINEYPELFEKIKVIHRGQKELLTEKELLEFLREACIDKTLEEKIDERYKEHLKDNIKTIKKKNGNKNNKSQKKKKDTI
ncbi:MAG: chloride channel protein [Candidatus Heimdallarchaeota archaeon]|nr:chloride channel protein [Candidatus Heimdallarchaeota archaeon]